MLEVEPSGQSGHTATRSGQIRNEAIASIISEAFAHQTAISRGILLCRVIHCYLHDAIL